MATFRQLTETEGNGHHRNIFSILAAHEGGDSQTRDGAEELTLDASELEAIRDELFAVVQDSRPGTQSVEEMRRGLLSDLPARIMADAERRLAAARTGDKAGVVRDGYDNPVSGIGTQIDPGMSTESFIPVSILPSEATAYYASGGIPARIINKKAGCLSLDGVRFDGAGFSPDDLARLSDYAAECGFAEAYSQAITQSLIFGGAVCYPVLDGDNPLTFQKDRAELLRGLRRTRDFIRHFVVADRWNCVFVPEYRITSQDYLYARSLFIPLGGVRVATSRMAMVRPSRLPFWGAIQQMGWSTSDFEGWIRDFESYQIMKMSLPIMAQQMSLMYHAMPADGLIIENGPEFARQFFRENEQQMREWSILHPRAINSVGEIKILERTYTGFRDLMAESRLALSSSSSIPESVIFAEKATGLASDNEDDITLKQSEAIRLLFNNVAPSFGNVVEILVGSCFGLDSEQFRRAGAVRIRADDGVVLGAAEKAQMGQAFTQGVAQLVAAGVPLAAAVRAAQKFTPDIDLDEETLEAMGATEAEGMDGSLWEMLEANRNGRGLF